MALSLASLESTLRPRPPRIFLYGVHGIGKSSFGAGVDIKTRKPVEGHNAVFIRTEDGLEALDVKAFPLATKYSEVLEAIGVLYTEEHNHNTVVIDSTDWLETLIHREVAVQWKVSNIDKIDFGKGFKVAAEMMKTVLDGLDALRNDKNMQVILLGHSKIKRFDDPLNEPYDRYLPDMHDGASSLISEWCDVLAFVNYATSVAKTDVGFGKKEARGTGTGMRMLYTQERPGWTAKSRWPLPASMEFSWPTFEAELGKAMSSGLLAAEPAQQGAVA